MDGNLFNPVARRAEDTLLLTNLMQDGELPLFVANATVQHAIPLSLTEWFRKTIRSACLEARTYDMIGAKSARFRVSHRERLSMSWSIWKISGEPSIGRSAWFVLAARQSLRLIILSPTDIFGVGSGSQVGKLSLTGCGKTRFEASAVPQNSVVSTTQSDKKKVCVDKTSSSWMCSAT
jgi:hypothetical protein